MTDTMKLLEEARDDVRFRRDNAESNGFLSLAQRLNDELARIDAYLKIGGWVSVEARLPKRADTEYWVIVGQDDRGNYGWPDVATFRPPRARLKKYDWYCEPAGINPIVAGVLFWKEIGPLPSLKDE